MTNHVTHTHRQGDHVEEIQDLIGAVMELLNSVVRKYCLDMDLKFHSPKVRYILGIPQSRDTMYLTVT